MQSAVLYVHQLKLAFFVTRNHKNELFSVTGILSYAKLCLFCFVCFLLLAGLCVWGWTFPGPICRLVTLLFHATVSVSK